MILPDNLDENLSDVCTRCGANGAMSDSAGMAWCADCTHRGIFVELGQRNNWPAVYCPPTKEYPVAHAVAEGLGYWTPVAMWGTDDFIWHVISFLETQQDDMKSDTNEERTA